MNKISMLDLTGQYRRIKDEIDGAIKRVVESTAFVKGPEVKAFELELAHYLGVKHVIACANGTDALQVSLMALGLKPGDEVITPDFTFIATVEVIALLGLTPIFVDVEADTFNIDITALKKAITSRTRAIIPVHLFGQCANMGKIMKLANQHGIKVIEDAAQSIGADFIDDNGNKVKAGTTGHIGCTSFFPSKNLACFGDGGALFTNDDVLADRLSAIINHGMRTRYYHDLIGVNSRLDSIQAAILRVKLKYLDEYIAARRHAANYYDHAFNNLSEIIVPVRAIYTNHVFHQYTLRFKGINRDMLKNHLESKNVPVMIYYPIPLHLQKAFLYLGLHEGDFPVTEALCKSVLSIPMHTELDEEQLNYITNCIIEFVKK